MSELEAVVKDLTGEELEDVLCHAGRGKTIEEGRLALHYIILAANETGQPKGQDLATPVAGPSDVSVSYKYH